VEKDLLSTFLMGHLPSEDRAKSPVVILYGQQQDEDVALLPQVLQADVQWRRGDFGTALQLAEVPTSSVLNMLQGMFAPRLPIGKWWRQWRGVAVVLALAIIVQLIATAVEYQSLKRDNLALRHAVEQRYRTVVPQGVISDVEKQLRQKLKALGATSVSSNFVGLMQQVGQAIASSEGTSIVSINYNDKSGSLRLNILAKDFATVEQVTSGLVAAGLTAVMESSNAQGDKVRARLRVQGGKL
jgi:type II secretion system protein L